MFMQKILLSGRIFEEIVFITKTRHLAEFLCICKIIAYEISFKDFYAEWHLNSRPK